MFERKNAFRNFIVFKFKKLKNETASSIYRIPVKFNNKIVARLRVINRDILANDREIRLLVNWRNKYGYTYPTQFKATLKGTRRWAKKLVIGAEDRILFFIESVETKPRIVGHMGLYRFDFKKQTCQIDNVIRGESTIIIKGVMSFSLKALINWAFNTLHIKYLTLTTFADNITAIKFYERCGFKKYAIIPLKKIKVGKENHWVPTKNISPKAKKYDLVMILPASSYKM